MTDWQEDPELHARFRQLKRVAADRTPAFGHVMARARAAAADRVWPPVLTLRRLGWAGGLALAATIAAVLILPRTSSHEAEFEQAVRSFTTNPALRGWQAPTDALLNVPGSQIISTIPNLGQQ